MSQSCVWRGFVPTHRFSAIWFSSMLTQITSRVRNPRPHSVEHYSQSERPINQYSVFIEECVTNNILSSGHSAYLRELISPSLFPLIEIQ